MEGPCMNNDVIEDIIVILGLTVSHNLWFPPTLDLTAKTEQLFPGWSSLLLPSNLHFHFQCIEYEVIITSCSL